MKHMSDYLRAGAAQSLKLLRESDSPDEVLVLIRHQMDVCRGMIDLAIKVIHAETLQPFNAEGVAPALEQSRALLQYLHEDFLKRLEQARRPSIAGSDQQDEQAYVQAISAVLAYNEAIEKLRLAIVEHNAEVQGQASRSLNSERDTDDLLDSLG